MKRSLTQREYLGWQLYWEAEPWGPWRDNMHAAIIAREIRRPQVKPGTRVDHETFMLRDPRIRSKDNETKVIAFLRAIAKPVSK